MHHLFELTLAHLAVSNLNASTRRKSFHMVRHGLEAELSRPIYYELAEMALAEGAQPPGLWSDGAFFRFDEVP